MKEIELTTVQTPSRDISFKGVRLIIECKLTQMTTPTIDDFYIPEAQEYIGGAYKEKIDYRKYVFV